MTGVPLAYGPIENCQVCSGAELRAVLSLGSLSPANRMRPIDEAPDLEPGFPADLLYCPHCHLVQLGYAVDPNLLVPPDYPSTSNSARPWRADFAELCQHVGRLVPLGPDDLVVDIGANDGALLSQFRKAGQRVLGVEPTLNAQRAEERGIPTLMTFFNDDAVEAILRQYRAPRVVTAANVFANVHRSHAVLAGIARLVGGTGVFVAESHYLLDLVTTLQYDAIHHEHLRYYSLTSLKHHLEMHGFTVFHVKRTPAHGGSIRVFAARSKALAPDQTVADVLQAEHEAGLHGDAWLGEFRSRVQQSRLQFQELLARLQRQRAKLYGIGASARAGTLIRYLGLDAGSLDCVLEPESSPKINKWLPGTNIPVLDEARLYQDQPDYVLLLSWPSADEQCRHLKRHGYQGDFIVPLPSPRVIVNAQALAA